MQRRERRVARVAPPRAPRAPVTSVNDAPGWSTSRPRRNSAAQLNVMSASPCVASNSAAVSSSTDWCAATGASRSHRPRRARSTRAHAAVDDHVVERAAEQALHVLLQLRRGLGRRQRAAHAEQPRGPPLSPSSRCRPCSSFEPDDECTTTVARARAAARARCRARSCRRRRRRSTPARLGSLRRTTQKLARQGGACSGPGSLSSFGSDPCHGPARLPTRAAEMKTCSTGVRPPRPGDARRARRARARVRARRRVRRPAGRGVARPARAFEWNWSDPLLPTRRVRAVLRRGGRRRRRGRRRELLGPRLARARGVQRERGAGRVREGRPRASS